MADAAQAARPHKILNKEVETKRAIPKSVCTFRLELCYSYKLILI